MTDAQTFLGYPVKHVSGLESPEAVTLASAVSYSNGSGKCFSCGTIWVFQNGSSPDACPYCGAASMKVGIQFES